MCSNQGRKHYRGGDRKWFLTQHWKKGENIVRRQERKGKERKWKGKAKEGKG